jgi:hypothetical protein
VGSLFLAKVENGDHVFRYLDQGEYEVLVPWGAFFVGIKTGPVIFGPNYAGATGIFSRDLERIVSCT